MGGFFLPFIALAAGSYVVDDYTCPPAAPSNYTMSYDGLVPCGRCLKIEISNPLNPPRATVDDECGQLGLAACGAMSAGDEKYMKCTTCHFFVMIDGIIDLILLKIVPPLAAVILIVSGIAFYQAGANPEKLRVARSVLMSTIIGLVIIYTSWVIVNSVLDAVGIANWVGFGEGWFQIACDIKYW